MPKVAINDEHMCLYVREKTTWLYFFIQTLQLKLQNVVTQIQRNKICVLNKNVGIISDQFNICTNSPFIVNLKKKIPKFDTLASEDMFFDK